jgi:hypothetical protein
MEVTRTTQRSLSHHAALMGGFFFGGLVLHSVMFIARYLPLVVAAIQLVENFVKPDTTGPEKKALATHFITESLAKLGVSISPRTREIISGAVDLTVNVLNAFGFFKSKDGPDAAAVAVANETATRMRTGDLSEFLSVTDARLDELERKLQP